MRWTAAISLYLFGLVNFPAFYRSHSRAIATYQMLIYTTHSIPCTHAHVPAITACSVYSTIGQIYSRKTTYDIIRALHCTGPPNISRKVTTCVVVCGGAARIGLIPPNSKHLMWDLLGILVVVFVYYTLVGFFIVNFQLKLNSFV